jgi:hypothetical protein
MGASPFLAPPELAERLYCWIDGRPDDLAGLEPSHGARGIAN